MSMFKRFATLFARYKEFEKWRKYAGTCAIGDILLNEMDDPKSPNYIELIFTDKDGKEQAIVTVVRASGKTPARILEEANERLELAENSLKAAGFTQDSPSNQWKPPVGPSASPLLQRIDDLSTQRDELLVAMRQTLAMLRVTSHGPSAANKAEEMLHAAICSLGADHSPDAAKMVAHEGWQLVPVEPTPEMRLAGVAAQAEKLKRYALGGSLPPIDHGIPDAYRAMLAAAPKHEGGAS